MEQEVVYLDKTGLKHVVDGLTTKIGTGNVKVVAQEFTDDEKAIARSNIGAAASSDIPTKVSVLENDSKYVTETEMETKMKAHAVFLASVEDLPEPGDPSKVYYVKKDVAGEDKYDVYVWDDAEGEEKYKLVDESSIVIPDQVQSDWMEIEDTESPAYIKNVPDHLRGGVKKIEFDESTFNITETEDVYHVAAKSQVQANWTEENPEKDSYIQNIPEQLRKGTKKLSFDENTVKVTDTADETIVSIKQMVGAKVNADGKAGIVPAPKMGDENRILSGNGTWIDIPDGAVNADWAETDETEKSYIQNVPDQLRGGVSELNFDVQTFNIEEDGDQYNVSVKHMAGASDTEDGKAGLVPAPTVNDADKVLSGAGTWVEMASGGVPDTLVPEFSEDIQYDAMTVVKYADKLYRNPSKLDSAGQWNASDWVEVDINDIVPKMTQGTFGDADSIQASKYVYNTEAGDSVISIMATDASMSAMSDAIMNIGLNAKSCTEENAGKVLAVSEDDDSLAKLVTIPTIAEGDTCISLTTDAPSGVRGEFVTNATYTGDSGSRLGDYEVIDSISIPSTKEYFSLYFGEVVEGIACNADKNIHMVFTFPTPISSYNDINIKIITDGNPSALLFTITEQSIKQSTGTVIYNFDASTDPSSLCSGKLVIGAVTETSIELVYQYTTRVTSPTLIITFPYSYDEPVTGATVKYLKLNEDITRDIVFDKVYGGDGTDVSAVDVPYYEYASEAPAVTVIEGSVFSTVPQMLTVEDTFMKGVQMDPYTNLLPRKRFDATVYQYKLPTFGETTETYTTFKYTTKYTVEGKLSDYQNMYITCYWYTGGTSKVLQSQSTTNLSEVSVGGTIYSKYGGTYYFQTVNCDFVITGVLTERTDSSLTITWSGSGRRYTYESTHHDDDMDLAITGLLCNERSSTYFEINNNSSYACYSGGSASEARGIKTVALGDFSFADGYESGAYADYSHAEGQSTKATGQASHAEGIYSVASGSASHAEGMEAKAGGEYSHAEGSATASGEKSHAEGSGYASGDKSHAEGGGTTASGEYAHAEGYDTYASGLSSHAEGGYTTASGRYSHADGYDTIASGECQHVFGKHNISDETSVEIVGWGTGTGTSGRRNIRRMDQNGNLYLAGNLYVGGDTTTAVAYTGVFWVTPKTTTYSAIGDANAANKVCAVSYNGHVLYLAKIGTESDGSKKAVFSNVAMNQTQVTNISISVTIASGSTAEVWTHEESVTTATVTVNETL